jgi:phosphatidylglycerophosphate synthase
VIRSIYTYSRLLLILILYSFLFLKTDSIRSPFLIVSITFALLIPVKRFFKEGALTYFETKLNYFLDEFFVYGAVILLSLHNIAPLWVVIIYFYKDATIGAVRNFAIKENEPLYEKYGYKIDKFVQYSLILMGAFYFSLNFPLPPPPTIENCYDYQTSAVYLSFWKRIIYGIYIQILFYISAAISASTLILFFFSNKGFMKRIHDS